NYDYLIIDNQAGFTHTSSLATRISTKAIIVSEPDSISNDFSDNLLALLGKNLPNFRRYLMNKVEIKNANDYKRKIDAFHGSNRLYPLPFDFNLRNEFGERKIPVSLKNR
ncbi:hypothetical protein L0Z72_12730, partial [candidate division KSB1 bacterium]|nr:hypothetical protein [candidate division KSB1 bacterium]